jgi:cobalamin biosynthesis protein CobD/CbiB
MDGAVVLNKIRIKVQILTEFLRRQKLKLLSGSILCFLLAAVSFVLCLFVRSQFAADLLNLLILFFIVLASLLSGAAGLIILKEEAGRGL